MRFPKELEPYFQGVGQSLRIFKSGPATQAMLASRLLARGQSVVLLVPGAREFRELKALLELFGGRPEIENAPPTPAWESPWAFLGPCPPGRPEAADWAWRWPALYALSQGRRPSGLLLTIDNLLPKWPPPEVLDHMVLTLGKGEDISPSLILDQAVAWGFRRVALVGDPGEIALRGDILDIFAPGYEAPLRLEFFGDSLEEIRLFDPSTQRSRAGLDQATLLPALPAVMTGDFAAQATGFWDSLRKTGEISENSRRFLDERMETGDGRLWPGLYYEGAVPLERYFPRDAVCLFVQSQSLRSRLEEGEWAFKEYLEKEARDIGPVSGHRWPRHLIHRTEAATREAWRDTRQIVFEDLVIGQDKNGLDLPEKSYATFADLFWQPESRKRPWSALMAALRQWREERHQTILSFHSPRSRKKFLTLAEKEDLSFSFEYNPTNRGLYALVSGLKKGLDLEWGNVLVLGEDVLQPETGATTKARADKAFKGLDDYDGLLPDDLLVHRDYGLARFGGLHRLKIAEAANDYLLLFFDAEDKLYLPVDRLNLVQRFKGPESATPALDRLGGTLWKKTRERARKAIEKIAQELVQMYAFRKVAKGYAYGPVDQMYWEFESTFGFEETPDQGRAIAEVFADMEKPEPMDRLVCGDVGFGKTEVALRAAFRAVLEGKQVALLCPTTILAEQHYQTFTARMENFPVRVGMLSRFVSPQRQKIVVESAARGEVDILIGTHRLLSKDVSLPRLGLLILDEEQRFGVKHKERLKEFRKTVDALTLTATPIPRTLQLSLSGLRGLSVIETPPPERKAVHTALIEKDGPMLKTILTREIEREGQVFWVYNRVQGLERVAEYVRGLVPDARVGMAHGQMNEKILEETMHKFWHGELDVLVCTAIVESGLDFPRANTLIVDQAQMFGLGQLYQLRGRVGRSERQAYAYFMVPSLSGLSELSQKRLQIILDLDYLGAGFRVAMEDLRLRGAGNILGESQSGQIAKVGLDLFLEMLEEEVRRQKGDTAQVRPTDPELNFTFEAHIPEEYIPDPKERLRYYRMLSAPDTPGGLVDMEMEIKDRFGAIPVQLKNFLALLSLKQVLSRLQTERADLYPGRTLLTLAQGAVLSTERVLDWIGKRSDRARLLPPGKIELRQDKDLPPHENLAAMRQELEELVPAELSRQ